MSSNESKDQQDDEKGSNGKLKLSGLKLAGPPAKRLKTSVLANEDDNTDQGVKIEYILAVENARINVLNEEKEEELVIPLIPPMRSTIPVQQRQVTKQSDNTKEQGNCDNTSSIKKENLDDLAAKEILKDILNPGTIDVPTDDLTIPVVGNMTTTSQGAETSNNSKPLPILLSGRIIEGQTDDERYRNDFESRPDELSVKSDVYKKIPIEKFGAALLRGMGWSGPSKEDQEAAAKGNDPLGVKVRPSRLGLGASDMFKKLDPLKGNNKIDSRPQISSSSTGISNGLSIGDIVKLTISSEVKIKTPVSSKRRPRAKVLATRGVPGLNRIRVLIEASDEIVDVPFACAEKVSREDLADRPYEEHYHGMKNREKEKQNEKERERDSKDGNRDKRKDKDRDREKEKDRKRDDSRHRDTHDKHSKSSSAPAAASSASSSLPQKWLRTGIRVKLVSKSYGESVYLKKGVVIDVPQVGFGTVRFDGSGILLNSIKEKHLETALPKVGGSCMILLGPNRGELASMIGKNQDQSKVTVQLVDSLDVLEIDADWVAECDSSQIF